MSLSKSKNNPFLTSIKSTGFTLTELLIVIALIAIFLLVALIGYRFQLAKGFDTVKKQDLDSLKISFENYYGDHLCYPSSALLADCGGDSLQPYIQKIPCDPETRTPYALTLEPQNCPQKFFVFAELTNQNDPQAVCLDRYGISSGNATQGELNARCLGQDFCNNGYYGCIQGQCSFISAAVQPACSPLFCSSNCQGSCGLPGWELSPQPCN